MADQNVKLIQDSTFRIEVPDDKVDFVNVTVHGENIRCGHNLYAMPLTAAESKHWAGIWLACPSLEMLDDGGRRVCTFGCRCIGRCKEIQVCRRPADYADSSWTLCYIIMRRIDGSESFDRNWTEYKKGFGEKSREFWAGNENLYKTTNDGQTYSLRVDLISDNGEELFALYNKFLIGPESDGYPLTIDHYDGSSNLADSLANHNGMKFTTKQRDNDKNLSYNCAKTFGAGWWFNKCWSVLLTMPFRHNPRNSAINYWKQQNNITYAKFARMMIRPNE
ncbi:hypothetical protein LSH36_435g04056 [Paralvinella palmiformis]|uniref:Fibrinogen C-terminal domain-containing protein n=1 Tax=Paralvinella palmiformis TaxID=53620 RepID=A0AAD9JC39_9ANNE|nr:hypothetical protein LSH36_435g04056 [Paralvinella palmiformis]